VNSNIIYTNLSILPGSELSFGIAMSPDAWSKPTNGATFEILIQDQEGIHEIFSTNINPAENIGERRWLDFLVDLDEFGGKSVSIYFVTNPGPTGNNAYDWTYWSEPLLLVSH
jgi:hypothetical protein